MWPTTLLPLLDRVADGQDDAWHEFAGRYREPVLRWARTQRVQPADAEDLLQEVLLKLYKKLHQYDPSKGRFRVWLRRVLSRLLVDLCEARKRVPGSTGPGGEEVVTRLASNDSLDVLVGELDPVEAVRNSTLWRQVEARIPPNDLVCYLAFECHGRAVEDIAADLGRTRRAVHQAVFRTRKKIEDLRNQFAEEFGGDSPNVSE